MPAISIIMPCYCNEQTIVRAVSSVFSQTFADWELIAIDDGSPEADAEVLQELSDHEPRVRLIRKKNGGVSSARNTGIQNAFGEWLFFLDADDWLTDDALETLMSKATSEVDIVCGAYLLKNRDAGDEWVSTCKNGDIGMIQDSLIRGDSALNSMCARLYRTSFIKKNHLLAKETLTVGEDVLFNLEAFTLASGWEIVDKMVYIYDLGGDSAMMRAKSHVFESSIPMLRAIGTFLTENKLNTARFRSHIDIWLRTLRADRGRLRAAIAFNREVVKQVTLNVQREELSVKERLYFDVLHLFPIMNFFLP